MIKTVCKDNRGLTLVELIVGVTILAIIVVPLLHIFVTGANTEYKSRIYGDATDAAQNLSEQIQANDADTILDNADAVDSGAYYYAYDSASSTYSTSNQKEAPTSTDGKYYIGIPSYSYGGSTFAALVTLDTSTQASTATANTTPVVVGNKMDALLNMTSADTKAEDALNAECGNLAVSNPAYLTLSSLTRSITLKATRVAGASPGTYTYQIDALFTYTEMIPYTVGTSPKIYHYYFTHTEQATASVDSIVDSLAPDYNPVFSVFMFFNGYYRGNNSTSETTIIDNRTGQDINFFLVNTNTTSYAQGTYKELVWYKYQKFLNHVPVNKLIYTNLLINDVTYRASENDLLRKTLTVTGYLVETKKLNRKFDIDIKIFKSASGFSGTPIVDIDSTKLNY